MENIIADTIFQDDNAILNLFKILDEGYQEFYLISSQKDFLPKAFLKRNDKAFYELSFSIDPKYNDTFNIDKFFQIPVILICSGLHIHLLQTEVINLTETINGDEDSCKIIYRSLHSEIDLKKWNNKRQYAYIEFDSKNFNASKSSIIFEHTTLKDQDSTYKNATPLTINGQQYFFYIQTINEKKGYIIVKSEGDIKSHEEFKIIISSIKTAIGLISGFYPDNGIFYTAGTSNGLISDICISYNNADNSICTSRPLLDNQLYKDKPKSEYNISSKQYNNLVNLLYSKEELRRSAFLLVKAGELKGVSKATLASVALETITNTISDKKPGRKLINDKKVESQLLCELNEALKKIQGKIENNIYNKFVIKIAHINSIPNAKKLEEAFTDMGILLNKEDKYCLQSRNIFFHGGMPDASTFKDLSKEELEIMIPNRIIMLSTILLLKKCGYEKKVVDWGYTEIIKQKRRARGISVKNIGQSFRYIKDTSDKREGNESNQI